ncbi:MAG: AIPR family protein [Desulfobacterales bacterium]|nr:AIPR family protein [Desulfobacterales bacterium]
MHRIVKSHLENFSNSFGLTDLDESIQFEMFSNFAVITPRTSVEFEIEDVTTGEGDDGTDGVAVLIDEEILISDEDAKSAFETDRKNHDVEILFIQAKRSESFDLGDFLKFKESILRFVNADEYVVDDSVQKNAHDVFDVCIQNVFKIRGGKPSITARYVATGKYHFPEALESAKKDFENQLEELGYFSSIDVKFIDRDELTALWVGTYSGIKAQLPMFSSASLPAIAGIEEAYLVVAKATDIVKNLLLTEEGNLRTQVFEENVRSFLGNENPVNQSIANTLNDIDSCSRFPVLNNGITIVSPDVRVQGNTLHLENFQIVNGCQTSNVLFENIESIDDAVMVNLKIIETSNEDVFSELVRATNSQSKVEETQFLSLRPIVKRIEQYFDTFEGQDGRLYFERRERQFIGRDIAAVRTYSVHNATKCVASMFFHRPDLAYRYPKQMYKLLGEKIFSEDNKEIIFYSSCLSLYRLHLLVSNGIIPQNMRRFKWHILVLIKAIVAGKECPNTNSKKIEPYCQKLIDTFSKHSDSATAPFSRAVEIIESLGEITDDRLKRQLVLEEMLSEIS